MSGANGKHTSLFEDPAELTRRFRLSVREALRDHKLAGNPIAVWRDGKVVIIPPEEITWSDDEYGNALVLTLPGSQQPILKVAEGDDS